ncbi:hypothetical protein [Streptomyces mirabilis]|uniref:Short chain dehydrogenase n=1 Tax=Streptomyces mirabilis TaxID=68239 RepID=A0A1I2S0E1_9ACTN|nr:hypothetical protein [Streptomyces mirabilis]SFG46405.1 hypothetical protein SAMN02787118_12155 [Streptomyces mirabilis]
MQPLLCANTGHERRLRRRSGDGGVIDVLINNAGVHGPYGDPSEPA